MRKIICTIVAGSFLIAGAVKADEAIVYEPVVNTGNLTASYEDAEVNEETNHELVDFVDAVHSAIIDLTPGEKDKLRYLIEFVASKNAQLEFLLQQGQFDKAMTLLERYNQDVATINEMIENKTLSQDTEDVTEDSIVIEKDELVVNTDIEDEVAERTSMRGVNLAALLERDDLPEQAKAGIRKALANQERAMENRQRAKERNELRKAERENKKIKEEELEEEFVDLEDVTAPKTDKVKEPKGNQKPKNENAKKGQERAEQAREKAKQKAEQGQKRGHEAKQPGESRGQQAKENGQGNSNGKGNGNANGNGKGNGNGNDGRP